MTLTVGSQVGPYEILSPLGAGGMGEVWKARDTRLNRIVAIKQCKEDFSDRFLREARAIAALNHPNICTLYDVGPDYLVMEYIEGAPPRGPMPPADAIRIALGIAGALAAAHARGITHRDLKPGNVLVTSSGVKLLDFGLATAGDTLDDTNHGTVTRTAVNEVVGTVAFMSPEQAQGQPVDSRSDIFSFGAVLYELLGGRPPFQGSSMIETAAAILRDEPPRLDAPPALTAIVDRCLRKSPAGRFQTIAELQTALEGAVRDAGVANRAAGAQPDTLRSSASPRVERVTWTAALTSWPALSSDARLIAYVSDGGHDGTTPQIWIQQIGGAALRLTNGDRQYSHLSFSPDNTRILFTASDSSGPNVYEVPALGGEPRLLHRNASRGYISPDGLGFACVLHDAVGIRISARGGGASLRTIGSEMVDVACLTWSPDSRSVLVHARPGQALEPDWWIVPIDGASPTNTGVVQRFRVAGLYAVPVGAAWIDASLIFSAAGPDGVRLYRQRIDASTFQPVGAPDRLTTGSESAQLPSTAAGRLAYVSSRADANLWSVAVDGSTGIAHGPLRRMTRGPHPLAYLTVTHDFGTLAYFSFRLGNGDVFLRDLRTGAERVLTDGPEGSKGYPAISPAGGQLAYGSRMPGGRALRPIFIASLPDGAWRTLGDDCGGRPREWVDERTLVIERFARLNSIALIDTETGNQRDLLHSAERSVTNPRASPDRRWIAFEASLPGQPASVFVSSFREQLIPESEWTIVDRSASHPFWSADGRLLYYMPTGTNALVRSAVRARHFDPASGLTGGEAVAVYESTEMLMPAYLHGTAPIATPGEMIFVLGDYRGDIWLMDLDSRSNPDNGHSR